MKSTPAVAVAVSPLSPGLRRYLYFTAAMTGAGIMVVEILGAKMLSPYLGTSHFVWTAQIAVTLVSLACGYYVGGWLVDRTLKPGRLYAAIMAAGLYLAGTIAICEPVAYACLQANLAMGSLLASAFLFFIPLSLLAMVGPFVIRVLTVSVAGVGGNVGRLTAISTLGSVVGTVLVGYAVIPFLPNSLTMYVTALLLVGLAIVYFATWGRAAGSKVASLLLAVAGAGLGWLGVRAARWTGSGTTELFRGNSNFGQLQVVQFNGSPRRIYLNDYLTQNTYDTNTQQSTSMFTFLLHGLARAYTPGTDDVLCIGLGIGIVPMDFAREGARVDAVEINPAIVPLGRRFFGLEPDKLNIVIGDGRWYVNQCRKQYDAIVLDAFLGDSCPSHLMTREAFHSMKRLLKPDGVLVINTFGNFEPGHDFFTASLAKTLGTVFPGVRIHAAGYGFGNVMFVAGTKTDLKLVRPPDYSRVYPQIVSQVRDAFNGLREPNPDSGRVLTDDYNPVEFYDAVNRERLRLDLTEGIRRL